MGNLGLTEMLLIGIALMGLAPATIRLVKVVGAPPPMVSLASRTSTFCPACARVMAAERRRASSIACVGVIQHRWSRFTIAVPSRRKFRKNLRLKGFGVVARMRPPAARCRAEKRSSATMLSTCSSTSPMKRRRMGCAGWLAVDMAFHSPRRPQEQNLCPACPEFEIAQTARLSSHRRTCRR